MQLNPWRRWLHKLANRTPARCYRRTSRPCLELLEDRCMPSTFTVLNTSDGGAGSLRQAILDANFLANTGGPDRIEFNIPTNDAGYNSQASVWTTQPRSPLPDISDGVVIDGYTQP